MAGLQQDRLGSKADIGARIGVACLSPPSGQSQWVGTPSAQSRKRTFANAFSTSEITRLRPAESPIRRYVESPIKFLALGLCPGPT